MSSPSPLEVGDGGATTTGKCGFEEHMGGHGDGDGDGGSLLLERAHSSSQSRLLLYDPDEPLLPQDVHVLFVEDEPLCRRVGERLLANEGYVVTVAEDGAAGWKLLNDAPYSFELIVSDVTMPEMRGTELLAAVRSDARFNDLAVVMMSSTEEASVCYGCLANGADDFLIKPLRPRKVANLWQVVWKKRKETVTSMELAEEKRKRVEMAAAISSLHERISSAVETPLAHLIGTLDPVLARAQVEPHVVAGIREALAALGQKRLYQAAFEETVESADMDPNTKAWLIGQVRSATSVATPPSRAASDGYASDDCRSDYSEYSAEADEDAVLAALASLETFEVLALSEDEMVRYVVIMFNSLNGPSLLRIDPAVFEAFVVALKEMYRENPYHNFRHAFDVTQFVHWMLLTVGAADALRPLDAVAVFVAALCHDVDHPGLNNNFQINTVSPLALRYNDSSVLENHHAAVSFSLMAGVPHGPAASPGSSYESPLRPSLSPRANINILSGLSQAEFKAVRKLMVACILGTDLASHVDLMRRWEEAASAYDPSSSAHRELLAIMLVKCADISNPMRPFALSKFWSDMIIEEGFSQGAAEAALGLPISPGMDPATVNQCKMSVGFIDYFVLPSFRSLVKVVPGIADYGLPSLTKNRYRWQALLDVQQAAETALRREEELMAEEVPDGSE